MFIETVLFKKKIIFKKKLKKIPQKSIGKITQYIKFYRTFFLNKKMSFTF